MKYLAIAVSLALITTPGFAQISHKDPVQSQLDEFERQQTLNERVMSPQEEYMTMMSMRGMQQEFGISDERLMRNMGQIQARARAGEFDVFDTNGDGDLDPKEIYEAGKAMGIDYIFQIP